MTNYDTALQWVEWHILNRLRGAGDDGASKRQLISSFNGQVDPIVLDAIEAYNAESDRPDESPAQISRRAHMTLEALVSHSIDHLSATNTIVCSGARYFIVRRRADA